MTPEEAHLEALAALEGTDRLSTEDEVRWALRLEGIDRADQRKRYAALWIHALCRLRAALDPAFDPADLPQLNIEPPAATGLPSGVAPEAVRDPALRDEYEAALEANRQKTAAHAEQQRLRALAAQALPALEERIAAAYAAPPPALDELSRLLDDHAVDDLTRARILASACAR